MSSVVWATYKRAYRNAIKSECKIGYQKNYTPDEKHERTVQMALNDNSLTRDEKLAVIKMLNKDYDCFKIRSNEGTKRICENCHDECLATLYCEHCVQNYLKKNFSNWSSKNDDIDNLIQKCQMETFTPDSIVEWIPYDNLQGVNYLTEGGYSKIYTAIWIGGRYNEWDSKEKQLTRLGNHHVILKELDNVENADRRWFEESKSHLTISSKWEGVAQCFGLTKNPTSKNIMLVMIRMVTDLRTYLKQYHNDLTWNKRIQIAFDIIDGIDSIHREKAIHRDLHSGNILLEYNQSFCISDLGFCGPVDKPLNSVYGNLPYIAPEVITSNGEKYTYASDIYSIGILLWEISSGQPPFADFDYNYDLAMKIVEEMRPIIISETIPLEYEKLMKQCWNADLTKRPDASTLWSKIRNLSFQNYQFESQKLNNSIDLISKNYTSSTYQFKNFPEPKNATEEEQEAFHSKPYSFNIPYTSKYF
ncbi:kinase-like domain-containing protein [Rhizophagus clarus]|uniref:Kinase-like domain-containing protein n=1 Tax=Rhizophagus clarus TaxID=94130 RepID=A0A8H3QEA4_9GLOM|nr:kinase-like domain-containing protein [Rhizophagus clarus]